MCGTLVRHITVPLVLSTGKKSSECIERTGEVAGTSKGSSGEKTGHNDTPVHAGIGNSSGSS